MACTRYPFSGVTDAICPVEQVKAMQDQPAVDYYDALGRLLVEGLEFDYSGLKHSYLDAFQRLLGDVVQEIGAAPAVSRPELAMLGDFAVWEKNVRPFVRCVGLLLL